MTSHAHDDEHLTPDPEIVADFLQHRHSALTRELADTFSGLQAMHQRARAAEQRVAELEQLIQTMQAPTGDG